MDVRNVRWIGVQTEHYGPMGDFLREVLRLQVNFEESTTVEFSTTDGDEIQIMGPGDPYFDFFKDHARGPVPLFEVADLGKAHDDLRTAGIPLIGAPGRDSNWEWIHFRAPDGNLYELGAKHGS
jgi:catechol 2,3-dioxygenase-like lactoylglutathione lyase family enzyme